MPKLKMPNKKLIKRERKSSGRAVATAKKTTAQKKRKALKTLSKIKHQTSKTSKNQTLNCVT